MKKAGLYIHVPFCLKKCDYCGFYSITSLDLMDDFVEALLKEMALYRSFGPFDTVYFGGGTPSLLNPPQIDRIIRGIHDSFSISEHAEWTIEANPGDLYESFCRALRGMGFNRINIGVQSLDDRVLSLLGRRHTRREAAAAVLSARNAGFTNMGLDFIYGIPGQDIEACLASLNEVAAFSPEHLSCYQLTVEEGAPLSEKFRNGVFKKPDEETEIGFFLQISEVLSREGYIHYEVSNYARGPEFRSRHNMKYWDHTSYLGLGPAAHSLDGNRRWWNRRSVGDYCRDLEAGRKPVEDEEKLTRDDLFLETLSLGLRTAEGIEIDSFVRDYGCNLMADRELTARLQSEKLVTVENGHLRPTLKGMAVADALAVELART